jgi:hypothetical protein
MAKAQAIKAQAITRTTTRNWAMPRIHAPLAVAMAVAVVGILAMLLVDHGPWNKPHLRTALVNYGTTTAAAQAAGARVTPTTPKAPIEPEAPGPKPAQPANDVAP